MSEITIIKGEEFKIAVKKEIKRDDIFISEYRRAAVMLDEIAGALKETEKEKEVCSWKESDFENNIIAFCGERGEGKSSVMMSFANAVYEDKNKKNIIFEECKNLKNLKFAEPILIDPSLFDDVHNVLDIVLAKLFRRFCAYYEKDNQSMGEQARERLLNRFQTVYRYVSLINNQKQMLDDEFDYEGNITKLKKLGESSALKEELGKLVEEYLKVMGGYEKESQLLLAIDDLDLCSANAYRMTEQIRKYLIIPHVFIVISVKIEQLELCIREKNLKDFQEIYKNKEENIYGQLNREVEVMAERYVAKLIPKKRRIYLPKVQNFEEVHIVYKETQEGEKLWDSNEKKGFICAVLDLIYDRTGMRFLPEEGGSSYLLPNNLRDMISWMAVIAEMENPEGKDAVYLQNIKRFEKYFHEWTEDSLELYNGLTLQDIGNMKAFHLHRAARCILEEMRQDIDRKFAEQSETFITNQPAGFSQIMSCLENLKNRLMDMHKGASICQLCTLYTIKLNKFLRNSQSDEIVKFLGGYIWGKGFSGLIPAYGNTKIDRSRFSIGMVKAFNKILEKVDKNAEGLEIPEDVKRYTLSNIPGQNRESYIKAWTLLGLLSNPQNDKGEPQSLTDGALISGNRQPSNHIQISLENYLAGLCSLDFMYEKMGMSLLGIEDEEFQEVTAVLADKNQAGIQCARTIASNVDVALGVRGYCMKNRNYKERTKDETERSRRLAELFFKNVADYMEQQGMKYKSYDLDTFSVGATENGIYISELYAELLDLSIQDRELKNQQEESEQMEKALAEFRRNLEEIPEIWSPKSVRVVRRITSTGAESVKRNMDNLATAVRNYMWENKKQPEGLEVEGLCQLYERVMEGYLKGKRRQLPEEVKEEYERLAAVLDNMKTEADEN